MARIGLVAGGGRAPIVCAKEARKRQDEVIAFGVKGLTAPELADYVDKMHWIEWGQLEKGFFLLMTERIKKVILLGKIEKPLLLRNEQKLDEKARDLLKISKDKKDYSILKTAEGMLKKIGIELIDFASYLSELVPSQGILTERRPTPQEAKDIEVGVAVARELARLDVGQVVCVKDGCAIALEGAEGTDETIRRAGGLSGGGFTVVKMARPDQDMRLDVPLVGLETVSTLIQAKGSVLALEAKKTLLIDREDIIPLANTSGISIVIV